MNDLKPPEKTPWDYMIERGKAATGFVPLNGPLVQMFMNLITPPLEKRQGEWMRSVFDRLSEYGEKISELSSNQRFITNFLNGTQIALRNHQEEKLLALRNAVINSINEPTYDESIQAVFFSLIERFTVWHIKVLELFGNPQIIGGEHRPIGRAGTLGCITAIYPFFKNKQEFLELILSELRQAHLIQYTWDSAEVSAIDRSASSAVLTSIGLDLFISFQVSGHLSCNLGIRIWTKGWV